MFLVLCFLPSNQISEMPLRSSTKILSAALRRHAQEQSLGMQRHANSHAHVISSCTSFTWLEII